MAAEKKIKLDQEQEALKRELQAESGLHTDRHKRSLEYLSERSVDGIISVNIKQGLSRKPNE